MRKAVIIGGHVDNIIIADDDFEVPGASLVACDDTVAIGDEHDGAVFTRPVPPAPPVPETVTKRQGRQALLLAGLLADVQPAIDSIADPVQRGLVQIEWDDSQEYHRHRPALLALAAAMGWTDAQLDDLFRSAAAL